nr:MAG TPA: hypothetical protein [Caudoviricetes sp.]
MHDYSYICGIKTYIYTFSKWKNYFKDNIFNKTTT